MSVSDGEKLIVTMLCDIYKRLEIDGAVNPDFVSKHVNGDFWAIKREYSGIFGSEEREPEDIKFVEDVLNMWRVLESGYDRLTPDDQERVKAARGAFGDAPRFEGFDGHTPYPFIATTLVKDLDLWDEFAERPMDSHTPDTEVHARMLEASRAVRERLNYGPLDADAIIEIVDSRVHPENR